MCTFVCMYVCKIPCSTPSFKQKDHKEKGVRKRISLGWPRVLSVRFVHYETGTDPSTSRYSRRSTSPSSWVMDLSRKGKKGRKDRFRVNTKVWSSYCKIRSIKKKIGSSSTRWGRKTLVPTYTYIERTSDSCNMVLLINVQTKWSFGP